MKRSLSLLLALLLAGCSGEPHTGPVEVSVIGASPKLASATRRSLTEADRVLVGAVAEGLVAFDASGQIVPALATRWDVSDDGLYYTFRLRDQTGLDARTIVRELRAAVAPNSRNALKPLLGAVQEIVAVTPQVLEIRLRGPRPNLLQLLAQPELALLELPRGGEAFAVADRREDSLLLRRPIREEGEDAGALRHEEVRLRPERAARAVARFRLGASSLVLGGTFADLPIAHVADAPTEHLRLDPAAGLFGLEFVRATPFLADADNRRALAMALDRDRMTQAFQLPGWTGVAAFTPTLLEGLAAPARPGWIVASPAARRQRARELIGDWATENGIPAVRVALPPGPGSRLLLALLQSEWGAIGVAVSRAVSDRDSDLRLVDSVAPADIASWYLRRFTCDRSVVCSPEADAALVAARNAPTLSERSAALATADRIYTDLVPFIPIATPLRWSLVAPALDAFRTNSRAVHPLRELRRRRD